MAPSCLDKQTAYWKFSHGWLVTLGIDLTTFCGMCCSEEPQLMPFDCVHFWNNPCYVLYSGLFLRGDFSWMHMIPNFCRQVFIIILKLLPTLLPPAGLLMHDKSVSDCMHAVGIPLSHVVKPFLHRAFIACIAFAWALVLQVINHLWEKGLATQD